MSNSRTRRILPVFLGVICALVIAAALYRVGAPKEGSETPEDSSTDPRRADVVTTIPVSNKATFAAVESSSDVVPSEIDRTKPNNAAAVRQLGEEPLDSPELAFFMSYQEYVRVRDYWSQRYNAGPAGWTEKLDAVISREDNAPNSRDLEQVAMAAAINNPCFFFEPPLALEHVRATCGNYACRVEFPARFKLLRDPLTKNPGFRCDPKAHDRMLYEYGLSFNVVLSGSNSSLPAHYFLANGFELRE